MNTEWYRFLEQQGATRQTADTNSTEPASFMFNATIINTSELNDHNILCYLEDSGLMAVEGPDSASFLQGQLTCDVRTLNPQTTTLGAHCTAKGRMAISFRLANHKPDGFLMRMHHSIVHAARQSLGKYIVFSKAEIYDRSQDWVALGIAGNKATSALNKCFDHLPDSQHHCVEQDNALLIQLDKQGKRYEIWCPIEHAKKLWLSLQDELTPTNAAVWQRLDVREGIAHVSADTIEMFIPQMLNYQCIDAISFNKGCYTGQEIVARMQYRGKLKRHMYRASCNPDTQPVNGAELYSGNEEQAIGNIVQSVKTGSNEYELLVVITEEAVKDDDIHLCKKTGPQLTLLSLPYAINKE